jgi:pimeloyl-ACP methyl ester carboxylesterase
VVLAAILSGLLPAHNVRAASSVSVSAWTCPSDLVADGIEPAALAAACPQASPATTFALETGGLTRRRVANADQPAIWPAVAGDFVLAIDDPPGEPALVVCERAGIETLYDGATGKIQGTLGADDSLRCDWYRLSTPAVPVATSFVPETTPAPSDTLETSNSSPTTDSTPAAATNGNPGTGDFSGPVDIGGRSLYLSCTGTGGPTIILEAGGPGGTSARWDSIKPQMPGGTRVCSYDRAGVGQSDPISVDTRTIQDSVNDLRALITTAPLGCPCILAGESWGANIVRLYAGQYPGDVSGLVLIDPIPPGFLDNFLALVPSDTPGFSNLMGSDNAERMDQQASLRQADTATIPPPVPAIVITHGLLLGFPLEFPVDQLEAIWREGQEKLANDLHAFLLIADLASNSIVREQPELVLEAITTVSTAVLDPANAKSTLVVRRLDGAGRPQPGACYQIYVDAGGGQRGDYRNAACDADLDGAENGSTLLIGLDTGDYVVEEITPPEGLTAASDQRVSVAGSATNLTIQSEQSAPGDDDVDIEVTPTG